MRCSRFISCGTEYLKFLVQSEASLERVENSVEEFIVHANAELRDMNEEHFKRHRSAAIEQLRVKPKTLVEQAKRYWKEITNHLYHFDRSIFFIKFVF